MLLEATDELHLSTVSSRDQKFDLHKLAADKVAALYETQGNNGDTGFVYGDRIINYSDYSTRIKSCGAWLKFSRLTSGKIKLFDARFCKVPNCPLCQWRRCLVWRSRFFAALPRITEAFPTHRWVFLTLTVKNCDLQDLRSTVKHLSESFKRLTRLKDFPLEGWIRSLEVTRAWDWYDENGNFQGRHGVKWYYGLKASRYPDKHLWVAKPTEEVHPHYHLLCLVKSSYFGGDYYLSQKDWTEKWKQSLKVEYTPIVDVRAVKDRNLTNLISLEAVEKAETVTELKDKGILASICETLKYTIKEQDLVGKFCQDDQKNSDWLKSITHQLYKTRRIEYAGILKEFGKEVAKDEDSNENLISGGEPKPDTETSTGELVFRWNRAISRYVMILDD